MGYYNESKWNMIDMYEQHLIGKNENFKTYIKKGRQLKLLEKTYWKACEFCGKWYQAHSINSRYCSTTCNCKACEYRKEEKRFPIYNEYFPDQCYMIDKNTQNIVLKRCSKCRRLLPINADFFPKGNNISKIKLHSKCYTCFAKYHRNRRKKHKDSYSSNEHSRYSVYKTQAKRRKLSFELSEQEAIAMFKDICWYCGYKPPDGSLNGIDRIDIDKGYVKDNVVSCCKRCNYMKGLVESKLKINRNEYLKQISKVHYYQCTKNFIV